MFIESGAFSIGAYIDIEILLKSLEEKVGEIYFFNHKIPWKKKFGKNKI